MPIHALRPRQADHRPHADGADPIAAVPAAHPAGLRRLPSLPLPHPGQAVARLEFERLTGHLGGP